MSDKLTLENQLRSLDRKDRNFYDSLDDNERRKFSTFLMFKYAANVTGNADLEHYYIESHNSQVNKHFFSLSRHPKLQWLLCTTVSPGMGVHRNYYIKPRKTESKSYKFLSEMYPELNHAELNIMLSVMDKSDLQQLARDHGLTDREIKERI